ncbi:hypothetical protein KDK77_05855 [bacterium]|nr:hypothetical protein [bacterium]MCP5461683.1 hypothetical protein [bacterium]
MIAIQIILSSLLLFFLIIILCILKSFVNGYKFNEYLKEHYYSKWSEITSFDKFTGPGMNNPFRTIPYIYSDENNDDENILKYKDKVKVDLRWTLIFFIIFLSHFIILFFLV